MPPAPKVRYREIFFAYNGPPPYSCYFCGGELGWMIVVHHKDENDKNHDVANLVAAHGPCHSRYHAATAIWDDERRARHRAGQKGRIISESHRANISQALVGRSLSSAHRQKISVAMKKVRSAERLARISESS